MRILILLGLSAWRSCLDQWTWRSFLLTLIINQAVAPIIGFAVWRAVTPGDPEIANYFLALLIIQLATVSYEDHTVASAIFSGDLAGDLLQPQPILIPFLGTNLALRFWHLVIGVPLVIVLGLLTGTAPRPATLLAALPALLLAGMLRFLFTTTVALTAFWTDQARNVVGFANTIIALAGGIAAPVFLLPSGLADVARLLPFWAMLGLPAEIAAGVLPRSELIAGHLVLLGWLLVAGVLARLTWRSGLRRFSAVGA
ncbi:ABC-2 family transporter protein [Microlunatus soli]|uniref:ABC-2 type transport system permease protein n=1 Tax=Microlunatus soli TaxID=630515 RepID=A0A1H1UGE7_9ACTN|nr:ABC-2 family transporter protein [Microlunatus soli]SDS71450.1 ABC-2 type transport system permease protein [Microlunatus soli]